MPTARLHPKTIDNFLEEEKQAGRMSGPFSVEEARIIFGGHFRTAPLGLVEKDPGSHKFRMIRNFSFLDDNHTSTNDWLNSHDIIIKWHSCYRLADYIASAPPGTQAASLDIVKAYRNSPIMPAHKCYIPVQWRGQIWADHNAPFGLSTSGNIQGTVADAVVDVLEVMDLGHVFKWVDNFDFMREPQSSFEVANEIKYIYSHDLSDILHVTDLMGVPWHSLSEEGHDFAFTTEYGGFLWRIDQKTVCLLERKRRKYLAKVNTFLEADRVNAREVASIHGTLQHVCFIYREGRSFLPALSAFLGSFPNRFASRHINSVVRNDLLWWKSALSIPSVTRKLSVRPKLDLDIWVDASTSWGIGLVVGEEWAAWKWKLGWKTDGRDIGWAEAVAVELATMWLTAKKHHEDAEVVIRGDNVAVIDAYRKGRSANMQRNLTIRRIVSYLTSSNLSIIPIHVPSEENRADPISRGILGSPDYHLQTEKLPEELSPFLECIV